VLVVVVVGSAVVVVLVVVVVVLVVVVVVVVHTYAPGMHSVVQTGVMTPSTQEIEVTTSIVRIAPDVELESVM
jgi:hypothetical protein